MSLGHRCDFLQFKDPARVSDVRLDHRHDLLFKQVRELVLGVQTLTGRKLSKKLLKILTRLVNSSARIREFHEKNLCYILPSYEIHFVLGKDESSLSRRS